MYTVERSADLLDSPFWALEDPGPKPFMRIGEDQACQLRKLFADPPADRIDGYGPPDARLRRKRPRFRTGSRVEPVRPIAGKLRTASQGPANGITERHMRGLAGPCGARYRCTTDAPREVHRSRALLAFGGRPSGSPFPLLLARDIGCQRGSRKAVRPDEHR